MKKHILSGFADCCVKKNFYSEILGRTTYETSTIEVSDPDEFLGMGSTVETRSTENDDPDEFLLGPTNFTKSIETSDSDEFLFGPTVITETVELSDPDEFIVRNFCNQMDGDFDELLLI